jgi:hypothetical protein
MSNLNGINTEYMLYTTVLIVTSSFAFYVYKFWTHRNAVVNGDINLNRENSNIRSERVENLNNDEDVALNFILGNNRISLPVRLDTSINNFINQNLKSRFNLTNNQNINLFFQGIRLQKSNVFRFYSQIRNESTIHCFIVNSNESQENENQNEGENSDPNSVSRHTLFSHFCLCLFFTLFLFTYKNNSDLFTKNTLIIFTFISIIWLIQFSKILAKLLLFKRIE